ncbi:transposase family protein [Empedobacter brevis]|uniref:transposase family protein n=1 Tax=Empedobacter brevis TaxID=247 RepID=UPI0023EF5F13|nr:transposase family protein [Empedobacter brevis]
MGMVLFKYDYSRYIIHWKLCSSMKAEDLKRTVKRAKEKATLKTKQKPNLLSDNGSCYVSSELKDYLKNIQKMKHVIGKITSAANTNEN